MHPIQHVDPYSSAPGRTTANFGKKKTYHSPSGGQTQVAVHAHWKDLQNASDNAESGVNTGMMMGHGDDDNDEEDGDEGDDDHGNGDEDEI